MIYFQIATATFPLPKLDGLRRRKGAPDVLLEFDRAILHREANVLALGGGDNRGGSGPMGGSRDSV